MKRDAKARALLCAAAGRSVAATAREIGVDRGTVRSWLRDPEFTAEVDAIRETVQARPFNSGALIAVVSQSMDRVAEPPPQSSRPRRVPVNPGPEQRARITARYHARGQSGPWDAP